MITVSQRKKYHNEKNFIKIIDSMQYFLCINSEKLGIWNEIRTLQPLKRQKFVCFLLSGRRPFPLNLILRSMKTKS